MKYLPDIYEAVCLSKASSNENDVNIAKAQIAGAVEVARQVANRDVSIANIERDRDITLARINASVQRSAVLGNTLSSVMSSIPWGTVEPPSSMSVTRRRSTFFGDSESISINFKK